MNKFFNKRLYKESAQELLQIAIGLLIVSLVVLAGCYYFGFNDLVSYLTSTKTYTVVNMPLLLLMLLGSILIGRKAISFAWKKHKTDYLFSLPHTKGQIFGSKIAAAISVQLALMVLITIVGILVSTKHLGTTANIRNILLYFLNSAIGSLIIIGALFLAASVTGKALSTVLVFNNIIIAPALFFIVRFFSDFFVYINHINFSFFNGKGLYIVANTIEGVGGYYKGTRYLPAIIFSTLLAAGIIALGYFLFLKRSGEVTENHTANKKVHYFAMGFMPFVVIFVLVLVLVLGRKATMSDLPLAVATVIVAILAAFAYDTRVHKKMRLKNRCIWVVLACVAVACAAVFPMVWVARSPAMERAIIEQRQKRYEVSLDDLLSEKSIISIYDSSILGIMDRQDELMEIYKTFESEFSGLSTDEKEALSNVDWCSSNLDYSQRSPDYGIYEDEGYATIVPLYVKGMTDGEIVVKRYKLTSKTPNATNQFMKMMNQVNGEKYEEYMSESIEAGEPVSWMDFAFYYTDELGIGQINDFSLGNYYKREENEYMKLFDVIKDWKLETPTIDDEIAMISYYDEDLYYARTVFIKLDEEQYVRLWEMYNTLENQ